MFSASNSHLAAFGHFYPIRALWRVLICENEGEVLQRALSVDGMRAWAVIRERRMPRGAGMRKAKYWDLLGQVSSNWLLSAGFEFKSRQDYEDDILWTRLQQGLSEYVSEGAAIVRSWQLFEGPAPGNLTPLFPFLCSNLS